MIPAGDLKLLRERWMQEASESHLEDLIKLSTHFTGDVEALSWALHEACRCGQLNAVT